MEEVEGVIGEANVQGHHSNPEMWRRTLELDGATVPPTPQLLLPCLTALPCTEVEEASSGQNEPLKRIGTTRVSSTYFLHLFQTLCFFPTVIYG
jgi:hypothetical protein